MAMVTMMKGPNTPIQRQFASRHVFGGVLLNDIAIGKKNSHGNVNFVLLEDIGKPKLDCIVDDQIIQSAFNYYNE